MFVRVVPEPFTLFDTIVDPKPDLLRITFKAQPRNGKILVDVLGEYFKGRFHELFFSDEYNPDFVFDPTLYRFTPIKKHSTRSSLQKRSPVSEEDGLLTPTKYASAIPRTDRNPRTLFMYHSTNDSNAITITTNELMHLPEGVYLNDTLIDFDLMLIMENSANDIKERTHIFSSFLYRKLVAAGTAITDTSFTKMNIFEKTFIFIPINEQYIVALTRFDNISVACIGIWHSYLIHRMPSITSKVPRFRNLLHLH